MITGEFSPIHSEHDVHDKNRQLLLHIIIWYLKKPQKNPTPTENKMVKRPRTTHWTKMNEFAGINLQKAKKTIFITISSLKKTLPSKKCPLHLQEDRSSAWCVNNIAPSPHTRVTQEVDRMTRPDPAEWQVFWS